MTCNKKWILCDNQQWPTQWLDQEEAPKHFTKPKWAKKSHSHCLGICCPSDPLQLSEPWQNHYIWELCSANRWDTPKTAVPAVSNGQQNGRNSPPQHPATCHTTNTLKLGWIGLPSFASSASFTWLNANELPLLQASWWLFAGKMLSQVTGGRKCFPKVHWILKHGFLCYRNKATYFSLAKICWLLLLPL